MCSRQRPGLELVLCKSLEPHLMVLYVRKMGKSCSDVLKHDLHLQEQLSDPLQEAGPGPLWFHCAFSRCALPAPAVCL